MNKGVEDGVVSRTELASTMASLANLLSATLELPGADELVNVEGAHERIRRACELVVGLMIGAEVKYP